MTQSLTEALADVAHAATKAGDWQRDQEAWNLPRSPADAAASGDRDELDWDGFIAAYFPASRRHDLEAIVAYGAYKSTRAIAGQPARQAALSTTEALL